MTENLAGRGEGLAGLAAKWRNLAESAKYYKEEARRLRMELAAEKHAMTEYDLTKCAKELETALEAAARLPSVGQAPPSTPTWDDAYAAGVKLNKLVEQLATPSPQAPLEEPCEDAHKSAGPVSFADSITNAESGSGARIRNANDTTGNPLLLLPDSEWSSLSSDSQRKIQKWFEIATEHLEQMVRPAATQEQPAGSEASRPGHRSQEWLNGYAQARSEQGDSREMPRKQ